MNRLTALFWLASAASGLGSAADRAAAATTITRPNPIMIPRPNPVTIPRPFPVPISRDAGFPVADPATGRPISPNTLLTLPNGKQMAAGDYYQKLNAMEENLGRRGKTLKGRATYLGRLQQPQVQADRLEAGRGVILRSNALLEGRPELRAIRHNDGTANFPEELRVGIRQRINDSTINVPPERACAHNAWSNRSWSTGLANDLFGVSMGADINNTGNCQTLTSKADGWASGKIFGAGFDLVNATLSGSSERLRSTAATLDIKVFGYDVYNRTYQQAAIQLGDRYSQNVSYGGGFRFMLGPIPVAITYGLGGSASFAWKATFSPTAALAQARPGAGTWVFVQGGIDIVAAGASVGCDLTLLDTDLIAQGFMEIVPKDGVMQFHTNVFVAYAIETLKGDVYVDAYIYVPAWNIPPWQKEEWRDDLFSWGGFQDNQVLYNNDYWVTLS